MSDPSPCHVDYAVDPDGGIAYVQFRGVVSGGDMLAAAEALHADAAWRSGFDVVWDCSRVEKHIVGPEDVAPLIQEELDSGGGYDILIENRVLSDTLVSEMLTSFLRRRGKPAQVCRTVDEALDAMGRAALPATLDPLAQD